MAFAEPHLLSRQYPRCATCHMSPTGGGLLTEYGRSLSHVELSTFSEPLASHDESAPPGEAAFLFGAFGRALGPLQLGIDLRPSRLEFFFPGGFRSSRDLWMTADFEAGLRVGPWAASGSIGREPIAGEIESREFWAGRLPEQGLGIRGGRLLPAYGVKFADHTSFNRAYLGLAQNDQVLGVEASYTSDRYLVQTTIGPGRAESIADDDGRQSFTATARVQADLGSRVVVVGSGLYRDRSRVNPRQAIVGGAGGVAPTARVTVWGQADAVFDEGADSPSFVLVNETSVEIVRGLWLKASPQAIVGGGGRVSDIVRLGLGTVFLPRTHWNINVVYYLDRNRTSETTTKILLLQAHLYL
jgi:hypothetical protein